MKTASGLMISYLLLLGWPTAAQELFTRSQEQIEKGDELFREQHYEKALEQFERAEQALSREPRVHFNRGDALFKLGRFKEAREAFLRATGSEETGLKKKVYYNIGNTYLSEQNPREAITYYRKALQADPGYDDARFNLELAGQLLEQQKKQQEQNKDKKSDEDQKQNQDQDKQDQDKEDQDKQDQDKQDQDKQDQDKQDQDKQDQQKQQQTQGGAGQAKPEPEQLSPQQVKDLLDSMKENEKAFQMHRVQLPEFKQRSVEKDW